MGAETRIGQLQSKQFKTMEEEKALREMGCDNGALLPPVGHVGPELLVSPSTLAANERKN
jgi:hypothetical protein